MAASLTLSPKYYPRAPAQGKKNLRPSRQNIIQTQREQKSEVRGQKLEVRDQRSEIKKMAKPSVHWLPLLTSDF